METNAEHNAERERPRRIIKRYSNRKLYDTQESRYVTLLQVGELVRSGAEVQIIDNTSKEDLTEVTLAQVIFEEQKQSTHATRNVPLQTLKDLLHQRTEKVLSELREGPIGRLIPGSSKSDGSGKGAPPEPTEHVAATGPEPEAHAHDGGAGAHAKPSLVEQAKETLEDWQAKIDERVRAVVPSLLPWQQLELEVKRLEARVAELESKLRARGDHD